MPSHAHKRNSDIHEADPAEEPRVSGIPVLSEMPWGTHFCVFYETERDLLDMIVPFFKAGLRANEFCAWALSGPDEASAKEALRQAIPDFDRRMESGQVEIIPAAHWYLEDGKFELRRLIDRLSEKLRTALDRGFAGMRVSGNSIWNGTSHWKDFCDYEKELNQSVRGLKMIALCTYGLANSTSSDLLDVTRSHLLTLTLRNGNWNILQAPDVKVADREISKLNSALNILSGPFPGHETLTSRERLVLAQIIRGFSSKEIARTLDIAPRTVEFHRANILKKTNAKNTLDLMRIVLGE